MTQLFREDGRPVPVTVLEAGPCPVVLERTPERNGYRAVQVGFGSRGPHRLTKPLAGHFAKRGVPAAQVVREFRLPPAGQGQQGLEKEDPVAPGTVLTVEMFKPGDRVDVSGRSIGKGFAGGMKRWHWKGGKETHGSTSHRRPGSIGSSTTPGRVFKGHHLPGHMGDRRVTTQALEVVRVDAANHLLMVKGSVPGSDQAVIEIRRSRKGPKVRQAAKHAKKKAAAPQQAAGRKAAAAAKPAAGKPAAKK